MKNQNQSDINTDANSNDDSTDQDVNEMVALVVKSFKKMGSRGTIREGTLQERIQTLPTLGRSTSRTLCQARLTSPKSSTTIVMAWCTLQLSARKLNLANAHARHSLRRRLTPHTLIRKSIIN